MSCLRQGLIIEKEKREGGGRENVFNYKAYLAPLKLDPLMESLLNTQIHSGEVRNGKSRNHQKPGMGKAKS